MSLAPAAPAVPPAPLRVGMLVFPGMTQLDFTAPFEVLAKMPDARVHVIWKDTAPVRADSGLAIVPDTRLDDCPPLDLLFVPGGPGQIELMDDAPVIAFAARQGAQARWVTSVCTGSLVLAAAGLLTGYRAACHWLSRDQLALFGAEPCDERVVVDRNRITGGGVTAGLDFALRVVGELRGEAAAQRLMLFLEYDPQPPYAGGTPRTAAPGLLQEVRERAAPMLERRRQASMAAAARLDAVATPAAAPAA